MKLAPITPKTLFVALALLLLFISVNHAQPVGAQNPLPRLRAVKTSGPTPSGTLDGRPAIDARALLDRRRAIGVDSSHADPARANPAGAPLQTPPEAVGQPLAKSTSAQRTTLFAGAQPTPLGTTPQAVARPQPFGPVCQSWLYNPKLTDYTGWYTYRSVVDIENAIYYTPPNSLSMTEDADGDTNSGLDVDAFGQQIFFPSDANSFVLEFQIRYSSYSANDNVYYSFWSVDANGALVAELAVGTASKFSDGLWHKVTDSADISSSFFASLQNKDVVLLFYTLTDGVAPNLQVQVDDIVLKLCSSATVPTGNIGGTVSQLGATTPLSDTFIMLTYTPNGGSLDVVDYTFPATNGAYNFDYVDSIPAGDVFQVWYLNDGTRPDRLSLWAGRAINGFTGSTAAVNFDIKDVDLSTPPHEAESTLPATFTWTSRGVAGDQYYFCIYDLETLAEACSTNRLPTPTFSITLADLQGEPSLNFQYGRRYAWYVTPVVSPYDGSPAGTAPFVNIGYTFNVNAITFVTAVTQPPPPPPPPNNTNVPTASGGDWTVMVYIAGDNNLGDLNRYPNPSANLQGQWATLKQLAQANPNIKLLTLTDFYDGSGTQFCRLDGTLTCQQLGEKDTSDPATLTNFITRTLSTVTTTRKMLIISDHGHSIAGVASDETTSRTATMRPQQIRQALADAGLGGNKLDILHYNVCLMGSFEAAFDASAFAKYMVASADEVWILSVYERVIPLLTNSATTTANVASGIVDAYRDSVQATGADLFISSAAYDLAKANAVNTSLSALATAMSNNLALSRSNIATIRNQVQVYDSSGDLLLGADDAFVDLRHLAILLRDSSGNTAIANAATNLLNAMGTVGPSGFVINSRQINGGNTRNGTHTYSTNAAGLSVFFPNGNNSGGQQTLRNLYLGNPSAYQTYLGTTQWDEFLRAYTEGAIASGPAGFESGTRPIFATVPTYIVHLPLIVR